jgi:hypothetical protein
VSKNDTRLNQLAFVTRSSLSDQQSNVENVPSTQNPQHIRVKKQQTRTHPLYSPVYPLTGVRYASSEGLVKMPTVPPMPSGLSQAAAARAYYANPQNPSGHLMGQHRHPAAAAAAYSQQPTPAAAYYSSLTMNPAILQQMNGQMLGNSFVTRSAMNPLNPAANHGSKHKAKPFRKQPT